MKAIAALRYLFVHIWHDWVRSLLSIISVAALVCVFLLSSGMINDMQRLGRSLLTFPESLLLVFSRNAVFPPDSHLNLDGLLFYRDRIEEFFGEGAVEEVIPFFYRVIRVDGHAVVTSGVKFSLLDSITRLNLIEGSWPGNDNEVLANLDFVSLANRSIGEQVNVYGTDLTISGLIDSGLWQNAVLIMDYDQAMAIYGVEDDFQIGGLQLASWVDPIKVHDGMQSIYKDDNCCFVYLHDHYYAISQNAFRGFISLYSVIQLISIFLITFGAYNATALVLAEHNREILLSRVIGFSGRQMAWILLTRTYIVMLMSFLVGWGAASMISILEFRHQPYSISGVIITQKIFLSDVLIAFGWISLCTLLGVLFSLLGNDPLSKETQIRGLSKGRAV